MKPVDIAFSGVDELFKAFSCEADIISRNKDEPIDAAICIRVLRFVTPGSSGDIITEVKNSFNKLVYSQIKM